MDEPKTPQEINHEEWVKPGNWSGTWPFRAYFSKRDSRIFVPQFLDRWFMPRTPNFGHRWGYPVVGLLYVLMFVMIGIIGWLAGRGR